jgi:hypothetical protein
MRRCTICDHKKCAAINKALIEGQLGLRKIALRFSLPNISSLYRHSKHLPPELVKGKEESVKDASLQLVAELEGLVQKTGQVLTRALSKKHYDAEIALKAIARRERQLELKARLLGELEERNPNTQRIEVVYIDKMLVTGNSSPRAALPAASINTGEV